MGRDTQLRNGSTWAWRKVRARVLARSDICGICHKPGADSVDHVVPISLGGSLLDIRNLRPAHLECNSSRGNGTRGAAKVTEVTGTSRMW